MFKEVNSAGEVTVDESDLVFDRLRRFADPTSIVSTINKFRSVCRFPQKIQAPEHSAHRLARVNQDTGRKWCVIDRCIISQICIQIHASLCLQASEQWMLLHAEQSGACLTWQKHRGTQVQSSSNESSTALPGRSHWLWEVGCRNSPTSGSMG